METIRNKMVDERSELKKAPRWTCYFCIGDSDWKNRFCFKKMCRYRAEIYLIEKDLLKPKDVQFGVWNPVYKLVDGREIRVENKRRCQEAFEEVRKKVW